MGTSKLPTANLVELGWNLEKNKVAEHQVFVAPGRKESFMGPLKPENESVRFHTKSASISVASLAE